MLFRSYFLLARDSARMELKYPGAVVHGIYTGKLDNSGEGLTLSAPGGSIVFSFAYGNKAPWPATPHGGGYSLALINPRPGSDLANPGSWSASSAVGGSPGAWDPFDSGLIVDPSLLPTILGSAGELTLMSGQSIILTATATGQAPLRFRWQKNGLEIPGATSASLTLANLGGRDAGVYSATVSNTFGSTTSTIMVLNIVVPRRSLSVTRQPDGVIALVSESIDGIPVVIRGTRGACQVENAGAAAVQSNRLDDVLFNQAKARVAE